MYEILIIKEIQAFYFESVLNNSLFVLFLVTLLVDVLTGNYVAIVQKKWNSRTGLIGTLKHLGILTVVYLLLPMISFTTNLPVIANGILAYIIIQYTLSIIENMSALGYDLDEAFAQYFKYLGKLKDKELKQNNKEGEK